MASKGSGALLESLVVKKSNNGSFRLRSDRLDSTSLFVGLSDAYRAKILSIIWSQRIKKSIRIAQSRPTLVHPLGLPQTWNLTSSKDAADYAVTELPMVA